MVWVALMSPHLAPVHNILRPLLDLANGVVRGSCRVTALYYCFLDKITVIPRLFEGSYHYITAFYSIFHYFTA